MEEKDIRRFDRKLNTIISQNKEIIKCLDSITAQIDEESIRIILAGEKRTDKHRPNINITKALWEHSGLETAEYVSNYLSKCPVFNSAEELRQYAVSKVTIPGLFLEFGVYSGKTINQIAGAIENEIIYGFDSFEGLPEDWRTGFYKNRFSKDSLPEVKQNVELIIGYFEDTLPKFTKEYNQPCAFIHIDCDLYSSTKAIFRHLQDQIVKGTIIVFDEYFNYPSWKEHEFKAFSEFCAENGVEYNYIGYVPDWEQVAVIIKQI